MHLADDTVEAGLEPLHGLGGGDAVVNTDLGLSAAALGNASTGAVPEVLLVFCNSSLLVFHVHLHADEEVHAVDTDTGVVLDTEIDVLGDTETEVTGLGEVALAELVLLDLEATLENLLGLGTTDGNVDGDLFVTADTEGTDSVAGLGVDGGLTGKLLKHLGGTGESAMVSLQTSDLDRQ